MDSVRLLRVRSNSYLEAPPPPSSSSSSFLPNSPLASPATPTASTSSTFETDKFAGFLCLWQNKEEQFIFGFVPSSSLDSSVFPIYAQLAEYSELDNSPVDIPCVPAPTSVVQVPANSVSYATITPSLHGTITRLTIYIADPQVPLPNISIHSGGDVEFWLAKWFVLAMMEMKRSFPGSRTFSISPRYEIQHLDKRRSFMGDAMNLGYSVLNAFSNVTKFTASTATRTAASILSMPLTRPLLPLLPTQVVDFIKSNPEAERILGDYDIAGDYLSWFIGRERVFQSGVADWEVVDIEPEFASMVVRDCPISPEEWLGLYDSEGRLTIGKTRACEMVFQRGCDMDIRPIVWKYLLGVWGWDSTESERELVSSQEAQVYSARKILWEDIVRSNAAMNGRSVADKERVHSSLSHAGDEEIGLSLEAKVLERKYRIEKDVHRTDRHLNVSRSPSPATSTSHSPSLQTPTLTILRDILLTYTMHDLDLGYVQGMADLLSPLLFVMNDEVSSHECFQKLMMDVGLRFNFLRSQEGMRQQLELLGELIGFLDPELWRHFVECDAGSNFWAFRWVLVSLKREFSVDNGDCGRIWESIWAVRSLLGEDPVAGLPSAARISGNNSVSGGGGGGNLDEVPTDEMGLPGCDFFHLFLAFGILMLHRPKLIELDSFDLILKYINDLSERLPVEGVIGMAEVALKRFVWRALKLKERGEDLLGLEKLLKRRNFQDYEPSLAAKESAGADPVVVSEVVPLDDVVIDELAGNERLSEPYLK